MNKVITKFAKWLLTEGDHACHAEGCHTNKIDDACHKPSHISTPACHTQSCH